jgi:hypothetical protein
VTITFTPTHFAHHENGDLLIQTTEIGDWNYYLSGEG